MSEINLSTTPLTQGSSNKISSEDIPEDPTTRSGANVVTTDTTMFLDDANVVTRDPSHVMHIDDTINKLSDQNMDEQSIVSFLAKPIVLAQSTFSTSDTFSFLNSYDMPYAIFQRPEAAVWNQKLAGVYGIRMDMVFRIVINANRFQQGRYMLGFTPLCSPARTASGLKELAWNNSHMATLVQRTTVPHVEFDMCDDTAAELVVPYMSVKNFWNLQQIVTGARTDTLGFLNLYPYSPLVSPAGSTTAGYTIYVSFKNVRLFGAASAQSGLKRRGISDREVSNTANGPISSVANAVAKGFKEFGSIPLLSTYANSISWVADRVANVASIFGYSKPTQGDSLTKMAMLVAANHNTIDGDSDVRTLSVYSKPGVVKMEGISGTEFDEMDFSYIKSKPAWFLTAPWTTAAIAGATISSFTVNPNKSLVIGGATHHQPVSFLVNLFEQWRGSLVFRIKIVRTEFHSGRIQVAFYPGDIYNATLTGNAAYVHRMIVDIRETPEFDFTVPYISSALWSRQGTGTVLITVVDPLVAPATVSNTVTFLHEIYGGKDFEVVNVRDLKQVPVGFVPQSGLSPAKLTTTNIGSSQISANPVAATSISAGESITSLRAYLKRYTQFDPYNLAPTGTDWTSVSALRINVDAVPFLSTPTLPALPAVNVMVADDLAVIASCYGMWRGGVRVRNLINKNLASSSRQHGLSIVYSGITDSAGGTATPVVPIGNPAGAVANHRNFQNIAENPVLTVEVPQMTYTYARAVADCAYFQGGTAGTQLMAIGLDGSCTQTVAVFTPPSSTLSTQSTGNSVHCLTRAMADDGNMMCFISVPPMVDMSSNRLAIFA